MNWKFTGDRPVYQQIMAAIRGAILTGELPPGKKVPSVRDLAAQAQVNPNTMQRALTELEREGLLISGGTSGRTVTQDQDVLQAMRRQTLEELAREYFSLEGFSCRDPAVYDAASGTYFYTEAPAPAMRVTELEGTGGGEMRVVVECYDDPLCLYPLRRMECRLQRAG